MNEHELQWSMFIRSLNNINELMVKIHLQDKTPPIDKMNHYREGIRKFLETMILISYQNKSIGGKGMRVPFVCHREGKA